jgi:uncharacterized protein YacL
MNKLLAETFSILNALGAILVIGIGGIAGKYLGPTYAQFYARLNGLTYSQTEAETVGIILGLALGFLFAVVFGGLMALLIQMHRELKAIRQQLARGRVSGVGVR